MRSKFFINYIVNNQLFVGQKLHHGIHKKENMPNKTTNISKNNQNKIISTFRSPKNSSIVSGSYNSVWSRYWISWEKWNTETNLIRYFNCPTYLEWNFHSSSHLFIAQTDENTRSSIVDCIEHASWYLKLIFEEIFTNYCVIIFDSLRKFNGYNLGQTGTNTYFFLAKLHQWIGFHINFS